MINIARLYDICIIEPIEKECFALQDKIDSKKILDVLLRPVYKNLLKQYEQLLCEKYADFWKMITNE